MGLYTALTKLVQKWVPKHGKIVIARNREAVYVVVVSVECVFDIGIESGTIKPSTVVV